MQFADQDRESFWEHFLMKGSRAGRRSAQEGNVSGSHEGPEPLPQAARIDARTLQEGGLPVFKVGLLPAASVHAMPNFQHAPQVF